MTKSSKGILVGILVFVIATALIFLAFNVFFQIVPIKGDSMNPTVLDKDRVLVLKVGERARGDIVIFNNEDKESEHPRLIKRIIGLPGDIVETRIVDYKHVFYVNGEVLSDDYAFGANRYEQQKVTVPEGRFYYLGDNRDASLDSRSGNWGRLSDIVGKAVLRLSTERGLEMAALA